MKITRILVMFVCVLISGCNVTFSAIKPFEDTPIPKPTPMITYVVETVIPINPTVTPTLVEPTVTPTPNLPKERSPVTIDRVKNVVNSIEIGVDDTGYLSEEDQNLIKSYHQAIAKKYPNFNVYYNRDAETGNHIMYFVYGGTLFHQLILKDDGSKQIADYPTSFELSESEYVLAGDNKNYGPLKFPGNTIGVIWENGVPQFLANRVEFPDGNSYFTHYLDYTTLFSYGVDAWDEVPGFEEISEMFPAIEMDLDPFYVQSNSYEYMGVKIKGDIITDESMTPEIKKIRIFDIVYAEFIARTLFGVWWVKGEQKHTEVSTESDFIEFMALWSKAQKSGDLQDWKKVQINNIWANDLTDGNGYVQEPYSIWPMFEGDTPEGVRGIEKISIAFVSDDGYVNKSKRTPFKGQGVNIDRNTLYLYHYGSDKSNIASQYNLPIADRLSTIKWWLININASNGVEDVLIPLMARNSSLVRLLRSGTAVNP